MAETINLNSNIWNKKTNLFLDNVRGKRPLCRGTHSISGGTFSEKAFLAGTQYFRNEKKKLEIINIKWQLDYILSWGQNDTKKTYHMACTRNKQWATNAKLFYFQLFHHLHTYSMAIWAAEFSSGCTKLERYPKEVFLILRIRLMGRCQKLGFILLSKVI